MKSRLDKSVDVLIGTYFRGRLLHGHSCSCAIGNMLQAYGNLSEDDVRSMNWEDDESDWSYLCRIPADKILPYTKREVWLIETAFEGDFLHKPFYLRGNEKRRQMRLEDKDSFIGLCNVFETLYSLEPEESCPSLIEILNDNKLAFLIN